MNPSIQSKISTWGTRYTIPKDEAAFLVGKLPFITLSCTQCDSQVTAFKFGIPPKGEGQVTRLKGCDWRPYQPKFSPSPPFPAYTSGHSTFGAAASTVSGHTLTLSRVDARMNTCSQEYWGDWPTSTSTYVWAVLN